MSFLSYNGKLLVAKILGASKLLPDYEEGAWTPVLTGDGGAITFSSPSFVGRYFRVGNLVFCYYKLSWSGISSFGSGSLRFNGWPFSAAAEASTLVGHWGNMQLTTNYTALSVRFPANDTVGRIDQVGDNVAAVLVSASADVLKNEAQSFMGTFIYYRQ